MSEPARDRVFQERWAAAAALLGGDDGDERAAKILDLLKRELATPVDPMGQRPAASVLERGPWGYTEALQEFYTGSIGFAGSPAAVLRMREAAREDPELSKRLAVALAVSCQTNPDDTSVDRRALASDLAAVLRGDPSELLRATAAQGLGSLRAREHIADLVAALNDPAYREMPGAEGTRNYPVRRAARLALGPMGVDLLVEDWDHCEADPPLVTGIDTQVLLRELRLPPADPYLRPFGVVLSPPGTDRVAVSVAVHGSCRLAAERIQSVAGDGAYWSQPYPGRWYWCWLSPTTMAFAARNVVCTVTTPTAERTEELAQRASDLLLVSDEIAPKGRPVPAAQVTVEAPPEGRPGETVPIRWTTAGGLAAPLLSDGEGLPSEGTMTMTVWETEPGLCVRQFTFANLAPILGAGKSPVAKPKKKAGA